MSKAHIVINATIILVDNKLLRLRMKSAMRSTSPLKTLTPPINTTFATHTMPTIKDIRALLNAAGFWTLLKIHFNACLTIYKLGASKNR